MFVPSKRESEIADGRGRSVDRLIGPIIHRDIIVIVYRRLNSSAKERFLGCVILHFTARVGIYTTSVQCCNDGRRAKSDEISPIGSAIFTHWMHFVPKERKCCA